MKRIYIIQTQCRQALLELNITDDYFLKKVFKLLENVFIKYLTLQYQYLLCYRFDNPNF